MQVKKQQFFIASWNNGLVGSPFSLKGLLQHSSKALILLRSAFFIVQLSHLHMTTGKTRALTRRTFVDKVMSLLFNMLSRLGFIICGLMIKTVDSYVRIQ